MFEEIRAKIAEIMNLDEEMILPESRLVDDLKADSMDVATLLLELEENYGIEIDEEDLSNLKSVNDIMGYIEGKKQNA